MTEQRPGGLDNFSKFQELKPGTLPEKTEELSILVISMNWFHLIQSAKPYRTLFFQALS
jgi:hypothetical protein